MPSGFASFVFLVNHEVWSKLQLVFTVLHEFPLWQILIYMAKDDM